SRSATHGLGLGEPRDIPPNHSRDTKRFELPSLRYSTARFRPPSTRPAFATARTWAPTSSPRAGINSRDRTGAPERHATARTRIWPPHHFRGMTEDGASRDRAADRTEAKTSTLLPRSPPRFGSILEPRSQPRRLQENCSPRTPAGPIRDTYGPSLPSCRRASVFPWVPGR